MPMKPLTQLLHKFPIVYTYYILFGASFVPLEHFEFRGHHIFDVFCNKKDVGTLPKNYVYHMLGVNI